MNSQYLFNIEYYAGLKTGNRTREMVLELNKKLVGQTFQPSKVAILSKEKDMYSFCLKTTYPGLLLGLGNPHALGDKKGDMNQYGDTDQDVKVGFYMDYTTGLPIIPGTTVKGVLRSMFQKPRDDSKESEDHHKAREDAFHGRQEYLVCLINEVAGKDLINVDQLSALESELFEGQSEVFMEAYPIKGDASNKIYEMDFITPHKDKFQDPTPIRILKVRPDVTYLFRFCLHDSIELPGITAEVKKEVFKRILLDMGIGAKTDVGFGILREAEVQGTYYLLESNGYVDESIKVNNNTSSNGNNPNTNNNHKPGKSSDGRRGNKNTTSDVGRCIKCGKASEKQLCSTCYAEAPKCPFCKKKVSWDKKGKRWYGTCYSHKNNR